MRAVVYRGIGEVRVEELPVPTCGPGELLVRIEQEELETVIGRRLGFRGAVGRRERHRRGRAAG